MPTQNVKHRMLVEAKKFLKKRENSFAPEWYRIELDLYLKNHPEFDPNTFKKMIRDAGIRNKQKEE